MIDSTRTARAIIQQASTVPYSVHRAKLDRERRGKDILIVALFVSLAVNWFFAAYVAFLN